MVKENSFEDREKRNKKRSSIVKMSELRIDNFIQPYEKETENLVESNNDIIISSDVITHKNEQTKIALALNDKEVAISNKESVNEIAEIKNNFETQLKNTESVISQLQDRANSTDINSKVDISNNLNYSNTNNLNNVNLNKTNFFNLNIKNDIFEGRMTTVRVYDDILNTIKKYAAMKNYPIIEFTNKLITLGLEDIQELGMLQISEIKLKNNASRSIMYNLTDIMEEKLNEYITEMNNKGYRISRNILLNVIINETLKKFYS